MNEKIVECLYAAVDETNRSRSGAVALAKSSDAPLYGSSSELDSLGLVNFIVAAEQKIEQAFGTSIVLADDRALSHEPSPFGSIQALADYIEVLLSEKG
jgi:acyl carrier protein